MNPMNFSIFRGLLAVAFAFMLGTLAQAETLATPAVTINIYLGESGAPAPSGSASDPMSQTPITTGEGKVLGIASTPGTKGEMLADRQFVLVELQRGGKAVGTAIIERSALDLPKLELGATTFVVKDGSGVLRIAVNGASSALSETGKP